METTLIKVSIDHDFSLKPQAQSFLMANGINHNDPPFQIADIEMVALHSLTYTSLKDLLPASPPPYDRKDSWREISIKDPLVKQAAWAYLQPMSKELETDDRSCATRLKNWFRGFFGCFGGFLDDVVWSTIKNLFSEDNNNVDNDAQKVD